MLTLAEGQVCSLLVLAVGVAAAALTIAKGKIFSPLRLWLLEHFPWIGKLVSCSYCLSHWLAAFTIIAVGPFRWTGLLLLDGLITTFSLIGFASIAAGGIAHLLLMREAEIAEMRDKMIETLNGMKQAMKDTRETTKTPSPEKTPEPSAMSPSFADAAFPHIFTDPKNKRIPFGKGGPSA